MQLDQDHSEEHFTPGLIRKVQKSARALALDKFEKQEKPCCESASAFFQLNLIIVQ